MAGRHLRALLAAYRDGDDLAFRRAAMNLIDAEEANRHVQLARDLRGLLTAGETHTARPGIERVFTPEPPRDRESDLPLADVQSVDRHLADLVLAPALHERLADLAAEVEQWPLLDAAGVPRRRRLLLHGPPGCGKTSVAAALAGDLGRPLVTVRAEAVVSSFLGETSSNLRRIFDFADTTSCVVLFDEFDSLGKARDDPSDHGELRRVVNAVLQLVDRYDGPSLLVASTNHEEVIDPALWRRFDEVLEVALPSVEQIESVLARTLMGRVEPQVNLRDAASSLQGRPHAAAERAAHEALRQALRNGRSRVDPHDLRWALSVVSGRRWI
jgi:SpoVK/Ycf46/Vps4 family AAA+-type ATPase